MRGTLPVKCCYRCKDYIAPPEDSRCRADIGLCKEGNGSEVVEVMETHVCKYFMERDYFED